MQRALRAHVLAAQLSRQSEAKAHDPSLSLQVRHLDRVGVRVGIGVRLGLGLGLGLGSGLGSGLGLWLGYLVPDREEEREPVAKLCLEALDQLIHLSTPTHMHMHMHTHTHMHMHMHTHTHMHMPQCEV